MLQIKNLSLSDVVYKVKGASAGILAKFKDTLVFEENQEVEKRNIVC